MDAGNQFASRFANAIPVAVVAIFSLCLISSVTAADFRTQNFIVMAPSQALAESVGKAAEAYRHDLADHWLGRTLPPWPTPCPIRVIAGNMPAQGVTQYNRSPVRDFQMEVVGTPERILDSVLPHEVTHTILATHFGQPLPRWADEGICTTVEHVSERDKHEAKLREFLQSRRGIAMNKLFLLTEYPNDVLPMYAQGYSVCQFLIAQRGPQNFVTFLGDYMQRPSWTDNIRRHYGYESLAELQEQWLAWVSVGNGPVDQFAKQSAAPAVQLASNSSHPQSNPEMVGKVGDGWYTRLRHDAASNEPATIRDLAAPAARAGGNSTRANDPPSIYAAAQPQPELGMGAGNGTAVPYPNASLNSPQPAVQPAAMGGSYWR